MGDSRRAYDERSDPLAGLPGMPLELLGQGRTGLADLAVDFGHLIRASEPRSGAGWAIDRATWPWRVRGVAGGHVVAAEVQTVIGMQMAQGDGIDIVGIDVAVQRSHGAGTAVDQQRKDSILVRRLQ